jgi:hypothetical protein
MGMMSIPTGASRALPLTLCSLPQAGEGNSGGRAVRDSGIYFGIHAESALEWE